MYEGEPSLQAATWRSVFFRYCSPAPAQGEPTLQAATDRSLAYCLGSAGEKDGNIRTREGGHTWGNSVEGQVKILAAGQKKGRRGFETQSLRAPLVSSQVTYWIPGPKKIHEKRE